MDSMTLSGVEIAPKSTTGSSSTDQAVQPIILDRDFSGNMKDTPLMVSSQADLNINNDKNDDTGNFENAADGDLPALKPAYGLWTHTYQSCLKRFFTSLCSFRKNKTDFKFQKYRLHLLLWSVWIALNFNEVQVLLELICWEEWFSHLTES